MQDRIKTLKAGLSKTTSSAKNAIQSKIDKLQKELDYNPTGKEKVASKQGKFYLDVPTEYAKPIYRKLWSMKIKTQLHKLNGTTKIVVDHRNKLDKLYKSYSDILIDKGGIVLPLSKISGKI